MPPTRPAATGSPQPPRNPRRCRTTRPLPATLEPVTAPAGARAATCRLKRRPVTTRSRPPPQFRGNPTPPRPTDFFGSVVRAKPTPSRAESDRLTGVGRSASRCVISPRLEQRAHCRRSAANPGRQECPFVLCRFGCSAPPCSWPRGPDSRQTAFISSRREPARLRPADARAAGPAARRRARAIARRPDHRQRTRLPAGPDPAYRQRRPGRPGPGRAGGPARGPRRTGGGRSCRSFRPRASWPGSSWTARPTRWPGSCTRPGELAAFLKAMDLLETELRTKDSRG